MGLILLLAIVLASIPLMIILEPKLRLLWKAWRDHRGSRGTIHRELLKRLLSILNDKLNELEAQRTSLIIQKKRAEGELRSALRAHLIKHIVNERLDEVPGIGPVLKERIIKGCFDGTLESLEALPYLRARSWHLRGIGKEKAQAVGRWAREVKERLPEFLEGDFPGKAELIEKYSKIDSSLKFQISDIDARLRFLRGLRDKAMVEFDRLSSIGVLTFFKAYLGDAGASKKATEYLMGIFPEWEAEPDWLKSLIEECK